MNINGYLQIFFNLILREIYCVYIKKQMYKKVFILTLLLSPMLLSAQYEAANWIFGKNTGLNFSGQNPQVLNGTAMNLIASSNPVCMSNQSGALLFYCWRDTIWNAQHQVMANGTGIAANGIHTTNKLIFKRPGNNQEYYLVYKSFSPVSGLFYSVIDMNLAAGMGSVTTKNQPIYTGSNLSSIAGAKHCNGQDYWVVMHDLNAFRSYQISAAGISTNAVVSTVGPTFTVSIQSCMKINPQGTKLALLTAIPPTSLLASFFDFDRSTGGLSNWIQLGGMLGTPVKGCEFSSDGSKFYFAEQSTLNRIHQLNLCSGNASSISGSDFTLSATPESMCRAQNGKIYFTQIGNNSNFLGVIHNPNASGLAMGLVQQGFDMSPEIPNISLPYFIGSQIKEQFQFSQGLGCLSTVFSPPTISSPSVAACWSSGNPVTGFFWNFGDPSSGSLNTSTLSSPSHTFGSFGTYTVKLAMSYSNCAADTVQQVISIVQASANVLTHSVACNSLASATVYTQGGSGNYSYTWMPGAQSGSIGSGLSNGVYSIQVNDNSFNCTQTFTSSILNPTLNITAVSQSTAYCNFSNAMIQVQNGSGNYSYQWLPGNQTTAFANNLAAGIYTVTIGDITNNCSFLHTLQITPYALPNLTVSPNATICAGQSRTLSASGADVYLWSNGSTNSSIVVSPSSTSFYSVSGTLNATGCSAGKTISLTVSSCPGFIEESLDEMFVRVFPNPFQGDLSIQLAKDGLVRIYSVLGREVLSVKLTKGVSELDLCELEEGLYFLRKDGWNEMAIKLIKTTP